MKTALLLIDIQNDYFPGGNGELKNPLESANAARGLLDFFRQCELPTVHIQHIAIKPNARTFLPGTRGSELHECILPRKGETIIIKHFANSFRETNLQEYLSKHGIEQLIVCGMMTHMCVDATVRAAVDLHYQVIVASDACATKNLSFGETSIPAEHVHATMLATFTSFAQVMNVDEVLKLMSK
jgi:nicotinamidase-related amidase